MLPASLAVSGPPPRRVAEGDSHVELALLPPFIANVTSSAETRLYLEDVLVARTREDFRHMSLTDEQLRPFAEKIVKRFRLEFDVNIERLLEKPKPGGAEGETEPLIVDTEVMRTRYRMLGFKFQRFLDSIKQHEDEEFTRTQAKEAEFATATEAASKLGSGAFSGVEGGTTELPTDLVAHMFKVGIEQHLLLVKKLMFGDRYLGVRVTFKDLTVVHKVKNTSAKAGPVMKALDPRGPETVWTQTLKIIFGSCISLAKQVMHDSDDDDNYDVLKNLTGVLEPGKACLLLGPPHAGKTSFFSAISGRASAQRRCQGTVCYNGHPQKDVYAPNFVTMVDQVDLHIPTLTVRETLEFAYHCRGKMPKEIEKEASNPQAAHMIVKNRVQVVMATLGLLRVADTVIGNEMIKGVSGGEARRVTLGEQLVTGGKVLLLDEISTGLDSAATYDISKAIRAMARVFELTVVVSLLQPPPETYELFDELLLMNEGQILYHGPKGKELDDFFNALQIVHPPDLDMADFLVNACVADSPRILQSYQETEIYKQRTAVANNAESLKTDHRIEELLVNAGQYRRSSPAMLKIVLERQWKVITRNRPFIFARVFQNIIMGLMLGALFYSIPFTQWYLVSMVIMQVLSFMGFGTLAILGDLVAVRDVYYKQSKQNFFSPSVYVVADYLVGLPFSCFDGFVLGSIVYFMAGLSLTNNSAPYFIFLVIGISYSVTMAQLIRFFGYLAPDRSMAAAYSVLFIVLSVMMSGAVATPGIIPPWYIWYYWAFSPMAWAYRSLMQNEFLSAKYQANNCPGCPNQNGQCQWYCSSAPNCPPPYPQELCGDLFLNSRQVQTETFWLWLGAGLLWCYILIFMSFSYLALRYVRHDPAAKREMAPPPVEHAHKKPAQDPEMQAQPMSTIEPLPLSWSNIVYAIDLPVKDNEQEHETRRKLKGHREVLAPVELLKHISGFARPKEMLALMGSSGAGKTTLLDVLAFRKTVGRVTGSFFLGKEPLEGAHFKRELGYIEQFGVHAAKSTVRESLDFSALLRLPESCTPEAREKIVTELLVLLELTAIEHLMVSGLSFEENKRLTIAVELVSNPRVVFADEPTSGLTSREALTTMQALLRVCELGKPVICTIHQPSYAVFSMFQRLLLLKRGGEITYFGPIKTLVDYFQSIPGVRPLPKGQNPATWMLEVQGAGTSGVTVSIDFAEAYRSSQLALENREILESLVGSALEQAERQAEDDVAIDVKATKDDYTASNQVQLLALLKRSSLTYWRSPSYSLLRWIIQTFFAVVAGTLYLLQPLNNAAAVQSRVGIMNMMLILLGNYNANVVIPFVFQRRGLFYRERSSNMYTAANFILSEQLLEDPYILWEVILAVVVFYFLVGMADIAWAFFYYLFLCFLWTEMCTFLAMLFSVAMPGPGPATLFTTLTLQLTLLFSGISIPGNQLEDWLLGFYYISPARWALEGLVSTQFQLYNDVMCYSIGTPTTYAVGTGPKFCPNSTIAPFYLPDVNLTACCNPTTSLPISARNYVLYGESYVVNGNNVTIQPFLGGSNGFQYAWRYWDLLYVALTMIILRGLGIFIGSTVNHQKR